MQDETQANVTVCLCLEYVGCPVSSPRLGQVWFVRQLQGRHLVYKALVQGLVLEGLPLAEPPASCIKTLLNASLVICAFWTQCAIYFYSLSHYFPHPFLYDDNSGLVVSQL